MRKGREEKGFMGNRPHIYIYDGASYNISMLHSVTLSVYNDPYPAQHE